MNQEVGSEVFTPRAKRALALIALGIVAIAGSAGTFLWRTATHPYNGPPPPSTSRPVLVTMTSTSERRAWLVVHDAGGPASYLFHTEDGGASWQRQLSINGVAALRFADGRRGVLLNYPLASEPVAIVPRVFSTADAGAHWHPVSMPRVSSDFNSAPFFLDPDHAWVLATHAASQDVQVVEDLALWRTLDGGRRWEQMVAVDAAHPLDHGVSGKDHISHVSFLDRDTGWMVTQGVAASSVVYVTHDGGRQWTRTAIPIAPSGLKGEDWLYLGDPVVSRGGQGMMSVLDRDANRVWVLRTADGGDSWANPQPVPAAGTLKLAFVDRSVAWIATGDRAWVTADSGQSWIKGNALPGGMALGQVAPVNSSVAWVQGMQVASEPFPWTLFRTRDSGQHWTRVTPPSLG
jgi:photosystem II stability/assembly factor-like uncharacterized protein